MQKYKVLYVQTVFSQVIVEAPSAAEAQAQVERINSDIVVQGVYFYNSEKDK